MTAASTAVIFPRTLPDNHPRTIRNIPIVPKEDLAPLLQCLDSKRHGTCLPSGTVDAYAAAVQQDSEREGDCDFFVLSSWLGVISRGENRVKNQPTLETYVRYAVQRVDLPFPEITDVSPLLHSRDRWALPLCHARHWVLLYIDFAKKEYVFEDSIPQSGAMNWAAPLFRKIIDAIRSSFALQPCNWANFKYHVRSPAKADAQNDGWSCGIFVMMSLRRFAGVGDGAVRDAEKHTAALTALRRLLDVPLDTPLSTVEHAPVANSSPVIASSTTVLPATLPAPEGIAPQSPVQEESSMDIDAAVPTTSTRGTVQHAKRKRTTVESDSDHDTDTEKRNAKHSKAASGPRAQKRNEHERRQQLDEDTRVLVSEPYRVKCAGCKTWIALHTTRKYATEHWTKHVSVCSGFTAAIPPARKSKDAKPKANQTLHSFLKPKPKAIEAATVVSTPIVVAPPVPVPCIHLRGPKYDEYISRTLTRVYGGISPPMKAKYIRELFPYKPFLASKTGKLPAHNTANEIVPGHGNSELEESQFTAEEKRKLDETLLAYSRWEVIYEFRLVKARACPGVTLNTSRISDACDELSRDKGLQKSLIRKAEEAALPLEEQRHVLLQREKHTSAASKGPEARSISAKLKDPVLFALFMEMERQSAGAAFLSLYKQSLNGQLDSETTFTEVCKMFTERIRRETSDNTNLKYGMRYTEHIINFSILMRSFGSNSAQQYALFRGAFGGPSTRHLRTLTANSDDALHNPALRFENVARFKRYVDAIQWTGPIVKAGDCTKVKPRLTYSNELGGHILGSTLDLNLCEVDRPEDIDSVMQQVKDCNATANQCRAILLSVPLPQCRPFVIALLPTTGSDTGEHIHALDMQLLDMCRVLGLPLLGLAADGASAECLAMHLMDSESTPSRISYINEALGINMSAPIIPGVGPVISVTDIEHARKTSRNQPQYGTHTASLGSSHFGNHTLVELYETGEAGMVKRDVCNTEKQDDGAARRVFHSKALQAMTATDESGTVSLKSNFRGFFIFNLCLSLLFEAWLNRGLTADERILSAFRARYFLHYGIEYIKMMAELYPDLYSTQRSFISSQSFNILNRACDSLILLIIAHLEHYPDHPFCPWLYGTAFVEHFFGIARMLLPNFTFAELRAIVKHILLRQTILLSAKFKHRRDKTSGTGYILVHNPTALSPADWLRLKSFPLRSRIDYLATVAKREVTVLFKSELNIVVSKTVSLAPLRAPKKARKQAIAAQDTVDVSEESDYEDDDDELLGASPTELALSAAITVATRDTARYAAVLADYEATRAEATGLGIAENSLDDAPSVATASDGQSDLDNAVPVSLGSALLDEDGKFSLSRALAYREAHQSETHVHSEKLIRRDPKFQQLRDFNEDESGLVTPNEAAHLLSVAQNLDPEVTKPKTARELRWITQSRLFFKALPAQALIPQIDSKNITILHPLQPGCFVIVRNSQRMYVGEVIELFKKGDSARHGSIPAATTFVGLSHIALHVYLRVISSEDEANDADSDTSETDSGSSTDEPEPRFSCHKTIKGKRIRLHTHAPAVQLLYNLGRKQLDGEGKLTSLSRSRWNFFDGKKVRAFTKIVIRGGAKSV